ncbi:MAG TPA: PAS domain S-box protein, partial [Thermodesulfobacteriota bacterium]|nr:PAS domain S-box protein [Thermodesulfobacteriota bacterium]
METPLRILHLEDNMSDVELVRAMLNADNIICDVVRAESRDEFTSALEQGGFDLILADYTLPSFDGMSALIIAQEKCPDVPFIFVSGIVGEGTATEALKGGATDYVLKHSLSRLAPAVCRALRKAKDKTEGEKDSSPRHTEDKPSDSSSVRSTQDKALDSSTKLKAQDIIRRSTKELLKGKSENLDELSTSEFQGLIQELQVYQVELEMQNEELRRTQSELEESWNRYTDLFDFAPIGYFMVDEADRILEVNFTGAALLRTEKRHLTMKSFTRHIARENQHVFYLYIKQLLETKTKGVCELRMLKNNGATFHAQLEGVALFNSDGKFSHFRLAAHDITERKKAEEILKGVYD